MFRRHQQLIRAGAVVMPMAFTGASGHTLKLGEQQSHSNDNKFRSQHPGFVAPR